MSNRIDLTGKKFGRWTVIKEADKKGRYYYWHCLCECGNERNVREKSLKDGLSKSCGCIQKEIASKICKEQKRIDLIGKRFGRLEVIERIGYDYEQHTTIWKCKCDCGNVKCVPATALNSGKTKSCGCYKSEISSLHSKIHGDSKKRLYSIWSGIKDRCYRENLKEYKNYGGRGIIVCNEWKNSYENFRDWALSNGYSDDLSIDRINNDGNYCPENCRWANRSQQCNNRRSNVLISYNGETHTATEWSKIIGIKSSIIARRKHRGWSDSECIETPVFPHANKYVRYKK